MRTPSATVCFPLRQSVGRITTTEGTTRDAAAASAGVFAEKLITVWRPLFLFDFASHSEKGKCVYVKATPRRGTAASNASK
tara:strand:- start:24 stop:266 length:243 start_codon:yes stop_codon:yes gene_type:complete